MKYRHYLNTTPEVSEIGLGAWQLGAGADWEGMTDREATDLVHEALDAGAARILLDNFSLDDLEQAVAINQGYGFVAAELEASGNVTLDTIRAIAETGVNFISTGALTKNVRAVDISTLFRID